MRKLVVCNAVSLDGYYAGSDDNVMVLELDGAFDAYNAERLRAADILLLGRSSFEGFKSFWPPIADDPDPRFTEAQREVSRLDNAIDKVVVSDSLTPEQTNPWHNTRIIKRADAQQQVAELKREQGKEILVFGSRTLWSDLLAHDLTAHRSPRRTDPAKHQSTRRASSAWSTRAPGATPATCCCAMRCAHTEHSRWRVQSFIRLSRATGRRPQCVT